VRFSRDDPERVKAVPALLIEAHETERNRIARELHDDIGQRLAVVTMDLDALSQAIPLPESETRARLRAVSDVALKLAKDIQALSYRLYPSKLDYLGLASACVSFCREVSKRQNVEVAFSHDGVPDILAIDVALGLFRVLQEAVTNAVKHAGVPRVEATLRGSPNDIQLEVLDTGAGFDVEAALHGPAGAPGLVGMQERTRLIGGELSIQSRPGAGTSVRARVPLPV
jgi:signal transduction histidine kinase